MVIEQLSYHNQLLLAKVKLDCYMTDIADFQDYNAVRFTNHWHIDWQNAIDAAEAYITDEDIIDKSTSVAMHIDDLMTKAKKLYQKFIKPFAEDAFGNDEGKKNLFGFDDYAEAVTTASRMVAFLKKLHTQCIDNQMDLINVGMNASKIAEIDTLYNDLQVKMLEQSAFQGKRMVAANERKSLYATMNEFTNQTCRTGKIIYQDENLAKYKLYLLPSVATNAEPISKIDAGAKLVVVNNVAEEDYYMIENKGNTDLYIYLTSSTQTAVPTTATLISPQTNKTLSATELGFDASIATHLLILWNENTNIDGKYRVEKME